MKIIRLNSKPNKDGYFPIPKNLSNRMMFCYPNLGKEDKWGTKERGNKKVNAIVSYYGELYGDKQWSIGMMGYESMIVWNPDNKEVDCRWESFIYSGGQFLYKLKNHDDWLKYDKNKKALNRMEKIDNILNR